MTGTPRNEILFAQRAGWPSMQASKEAKQGLYRGFPKLGAPFFGGGPYNKDYRILGSMLGSPYLGKLPFREMLGLGRRVS